MSRQQVIVKQLLAIENLGSMTVLCSDKTGTLTDGIIQLHDTLDVAGQPSERVLQYAWYNAVLQTGFENPIDRAIRDKQTFDMSGVEKLDEIPYDFIRKRLSVRIRHNAGERLLITKGALANILECCARAETAPGEYMDIQSQRAETDRRRRDERAGLARSRPGGARRQRGAHQQVGRARHDIPGVPGLRRSAEGRCQRHVAATP